MHLAYSQLRNALIWQDERSAQFDAACRAKFGWLAQYLALDLSVCYSYEHQRGCSDFMRVLLNASTKNSVELKNKMGHTGHTATVRSRTEQIPSARITRIAGE